MTMHDGVLQFGGAAYRGVLRKIRLDRGDGGVLDVLRRGEVRLAGGEIDDVSTLLAQLSASAATAMVEEGSMRLMRSVRTA